MLKEKNKTKKKQNISLPKSPFDKKFFSKIMQTNLDREIIKRNKIISTIKKNIEAQYFYRNETETKDLPISSQQKKVKKVKMSPKKKLILRKVVKDSILNCKIDLGNMALFSFGKRRNSIVSDMRQEKLLSNCKNFVFAQPKDISNNEYNRIKLLNFNKRRDRRVFTAIINRKGIPLTNSSRKRYSQYFNSTFYNNKRKNLLSAQSNTKQKNLISRNNTFCTNSNNDLHLLNLTSRSKNDSDNKDINITYNSETNNNKNKKSCIYNYSENKAKGHNFNYPFTSRNKTLYTNNSNGNSYFDFTNFTPKKINYDNIFNSENSRLPRNFSFNKLVKKLSFSSSFYKKNKPDKISSQKNIKELTSKFNAYFNKKVKSLNNINKICNNELIKIIDINQSKNSNIIEKKNIDEVKNELDVRKDIYDEDSNIKLNSEKKEKHKILMNDIKVDINLQDANSKKAMNILRKKINIISDTIALNLVEHNLGIKKNEGFDIDELLNEYYHKKEEIEKMKISHIRQKAENNYNKIIKLSYTLSNQKFFKKSKKVS